MIKIIPLTPNYIKELHEIEKATFSEPWSEMTFIKELENPSAHYFIALKDEKIVGYAGMCAIFDEGHIMNIAVAASQRRSGVGRQLIKILIDKAHELNLIGLTLEVRESNTPAINLYESLGFVSVGQRKAYYHYPIEDGIIMWNFFGGG